jgi:hypothetical protein
VTSPASALSDHCDAVAILVLLVALALGADRAIARLLAPLCTDHVRIARLAYDLTLQPEWPVATTQ